MIDTSSSAPDIDFTGTVSRDWITRGTWLSEAATAFADGSMASMQRMMDEGRQAFTKLRQGQTPEAFLLLSEGRRDRGPELEGDALAALEKYEGGLGALEVNLVSRLCFGTLVAFGEFGRPGAGWQWIPVQAWMYLAIDPSTRNKVNGEAGTFWHVKVLDPAHENLATPPNKVAPLVFTQPNPAEDDQIRDAMRKVYSYPGKPKNKAELYTSVNDELKKLALKATKTEVTRIAGESEFVARRRPPGVPAGTKRRGFNSSISSRQEE